MNSNTHNICEDWGWYVDIENNLLINSNKSQLYICYNKLSKIEEDDYFKYIEDDYSRYIEDLESEECMYKNNKEKNALMSFYTIGSTTLISALLTYSILFLII